MTKVVICRNYYNIVVNNNQNLTQIEEVSLVNNNELFIYEQYIRYITLELCVELLKFLNSPLFQNIILPLIISLLL